ncbi:uncharacterized protein LOC128669717 [Plodia interpunctella]|uniref:uncharacterized protein LOC128669717 n=1 Tax=Plodia interpunctella TaxID=58824 RepID=UPI0031019CC8
MLVARRIVWAWIVFAGVCAGGASESRLVQIDQGPVRGYQDAESGVFVFSSIPYATAPTGKDKYKTPLPPPKWQEPYEAVDKGIICPQFRSPFYKGKSMQEDCLITSVYVPDTDQKNLPVVVYIHGSGFQMGYGDQGTPKYLAKKNLIAVTFNHRLGVHGFLCLGTPTVPGNAGLKDQLAALRWVKRNIASFGGNPDDITLAGYSAGSASLDLLLLSPAAKGLFQKAIPESGANVAVFTMQQNPIEKAILHARRISNFSKVDDIQALEDFYTTESYDNLCSVFYLNEFFNSDIGFTPCIERSVGEEIIIDEVPLNILKSGNFPKIPLLYGFANMEGISRMPLFNVYKDRMNSKFPDFLPADLTFENKKQKEEVAEIIKDFYFQGKEIEEDMPSMLNFVDFFTDTMFGYPALRSVELQRLAGNKNIYLYSYSFVDVGGNSLQYKNYTTDKGATHCAQSFAVLDYRNMLTGEFVDENTLSDEFKQMKEVMRQVWYNFIATGNPVPEGSNLPSWPPMGADWSPHMSLGNQIKLEGSLMLERGRFWDQIYQKYYSLPKPPSPTERIMLVARRIVWAWIVFAGVCAGGAFKSRLVQIDQGPVRGYQDAESGVFVFSSIPYATAPTGKDKYKAPLPPPKWQEPYEAVDKGIVCPQFKSPFFEGKSMQEDCLITSVYVPDTDQKNLPVVVYIHGSGFQVGYGDQVTPKHLAKKNLIAVTFNHRLGVHGFLCLGTPTVPGNAGLKDQLAVLRWVKRNIASFGGNPDDITLAGYSAGSASLDLLLLSPAAKGLFQKAIPESGANVAVFTMQQNPIEKAILHARRISNFSKVDDIEALEDFYTTESYDNLCSVFYLNEFFNSDVGFTPCIERSVGEEIIIDEVPLNILKSGNFPKIPLLYGFANMEGIFRMSLFNVYKDRMNSKFSDFLPADLTFENEKQKEEVAEIIKDFYFQGKEIEEDMPSMLNFVDFFTDTMFGYPALRSVELQRLAGNKNIYLYSYSFVDVGGNSLQYKDYTTDKGATHCAQSFAIFDYRNMLTGEFVDENTLSDEFKQMKEVMRQVWYNFIATGNPVPEGSNLPSWPPMGADWSPHMSLGNQIKLEGSLMLERGRFWDQIYQKYYSLPKPPSPPVRHIELTPAAVMWKTCYFLFMVLTCINGDTDNSNEVKIVKTPQGPVRGYRDPDYNIFIFKNIPYATAPTGKYRFTAPLPAPAWLDTFDAVDNGTICPQNADKNMLRTGREQEAENCLIANVYVPNTKVKKLPVVVYVHGGGFQIGYGAVFTPKQFVKNKQVIEVTFNYRLAVHGFLCLGTELAPGNAGMKDQVALLRWVKKNIASYGGNPEDVTIVGSSAGSASVDLLLLSPAAKGLFHRAIPESGTNIAPWAIEVDPLEKAKKFAKLFNFTNVDDTYALENFYTTSPLELFTSYLKLDEKDSTFGFVPCVERATIEEGFITDSPLNILKSGKFTKVPLLYGFANMEGLIRMIFFETWKDDMNKKFSDFLPADLIFDNEEQKEEVATNVKQFYFGDQPVGVDTMLAYIDYFSDVMFGYPALRSLKLQKEAGNNKIYLYEYSFAEKGGNPTGYKDYTVNGANHCAQSTAILDWPFFLGPEREASEEYKEMKKILSDTWHNFITTDKPVPPGSSLPAWPPMGEAWSPHMSLGRVVELRGSLLEERARFWDDIYQLYYRNPVPPPSPPARHQEL